MSAPTIAPPKPGVAPTPAPSRPIHKPIRHPNPFRRKTPNPSHKPTPEKAEFYINAAETLVQQVLLKARGQKESAHATEPNEEDTELQIALDLLDIAARNGGDDVLSPRNPWSQVLKLGRQLHDLHRPRPNAMAHRLITRSGLPYK
jgi:hypothetical protein